MMPGYNNRHLLSQMSIPRCYFDKKSKPLVSRTRPKLLMQLHVIYLRTSDCIHTALVMSKSKVAPS